MNNQASANSKTRGGTASLTKTVLGVAMGGLLAGFSQPFVWPGDVEAALIDPSGLTGLLVFFAMVPALLPLRSATQRQAYGVGLLFCWVQLVVVFHWIVVAMHVFGKLPLSVSLAGLALLGVATGGQVALAWWMTQRILNRFKLPLWLVFPLALSGIELFRNSVLYGGFPWGNLGNSLASVPVCLQAASLFGVYGLVFWIALVNAVVTELIWWRKGVQSFPKWGIVIAVASSACLMVFGVMRLQASVPATQSLKVALLQGNIEQGIKNKQKQHKGLILRKYQRLQNAAHTEGVDLIVWPEASLPGGVGLHQTDLKRFGVPAFKPEPAKKPRTLVGAVVVDRDVRVPGSKKKTFRLFNSALMLDEDLTRVGRFDKSHLVPFGEYVPWPFYKLVRKIVPNVGRFQPGLVQRPLPVPTASGEVHIGATVCYEGVFPEISRELVNGGAQVLVNMTNDAWYGYSSAPWQHLYMYKLRSVETGVPFVRATNTGITAWIDDKGFLHRPSKLYEETMLIAEVPVGHRNTLFNAWGEWVALPAFVLVLALFLLSFFGSGPRPKWADFSGKLAVTAPLWSSGIYRYLHTGHRDVNTVTQILLANIALLLIGVALLGEATYKKRRLKRTAFFLVAFAAMGCGVGQWMYGILVPIGLGLWIWSKK